MNEAFLIFGAHVSNITQHQGKSTWLIGEDERRAGRLITFYERSKVKGNQILMAEQIGN
jgi:hypothetical protein